MTTLFAEVVQETEKLSDTAQNELAQRILDDVMSELRWQELRIRSIGGNG